MKKLLIGIALVMALCAGAVGPAMADTWDTWDSWSTYDNDWWETDNWDNDDWGYYDPDYGWDVTDPDWNTWYGDYDSDWNTYDDIGDEGWLDV